MKKGVTDTKEFLNEEKATSLSFQPKEQELSSNTLPKVEKALNQQALIFTRDYQWGSIVLGVEQANTYRIQNQGSTGVTTTCLTCRWSYDWIHV